MKSRLLVLIIGLSLVAASCNKQSTAAIKPIMALNDCVETKISQIGTRLMNNGNEVMDSGSSVTYDNGVYQVSYDTIVGLNISQIGDPVQLCLVSIPTNCPLGDDRGKTYQALNRRTGNSWIAQDSEHSCGGN